MPAAKKPPKPREFRAARIMPIVVAQKRPVDPSEQETPEETLRRDTQWDLAMIKELFFEAMLAKRRRPTIAELSAKTGLKPGRVEAVIRMIDMEEILRPYKLGLELVLQNLFIKAVKADNERLLRLYFEVIGVLNPNKSPGPFNGYPDQPQIATAPLNDSQVADVIAALRQGFNKKKDQAKTNR